MVVEATEQEGIEALLVRLQALLTQQAMPRGESVFEAVTREQLGELKADVKAIEARLEDIPALGEIQREVRELRRLVTGLIGAVGLAVLVELAKLGLGLR